MEDSNPYQPPADMLPEHVESQLQADEQQARLRLTRDVPGIDFWLVSGIGTLLLLLASVMPNSPVFVFLLAWLGGSLRVCLVYSARARVGLPPLNAIELLLTSKAICLILQVVAACVVCGLLAVARWFLQLRTSLTISLSGTILIFILVYIILFLWSIRWARQA